VPPLLALAGGAALVFAVVMTVAKPVEGQVEG
jgi:hypothetical protein